jgi:hypothetical protein
MLQSISKSPCNKLGPSPSLTSVFSSFQFCCKSLKNGSIAFQLPQKRSFRSSAFHLKGENPVQKIKNLNRDEIKAIHAKTPPESKRTTSLQERPLEDISDVIKPIVAILHPSTRGN